MPLGQTKAPVGIFTYIWLIFLVNEYIGKYTIHGSYGDMVGSILPKPPPAVVVPERKRGIWTGGHHTYHSPADHMSNEHLGPGSCLGSLLRMKN